MHKPWLMYSLELKVSVIFLNNPILPIISKCHQQQFVPRVHCALCLIGIVQNRLHICNLYRKPCISFSTVNCLSARRLSHTAPSEQSIFRRKCVVHRRKCVFSRVSILFSIQQKQQSHLKVHDVRNKIVFV